MHSTRHVSTPLILSRFAEPSVFLSPSTGTLATSISLLPATMKRSAPTTVVEGSTTAVKRQRSMGILLDQLPAHHYFLGGDMISKVTDFTGTTRVHIRKYLLEEQSYHPTKFGLTVSPAAFKELMDNVNRIECMKNMRILNKELLVSRTSAEEGGSDYSFQQMFRSQDGGHRLNSTCVTLNYQQFQELANVCGQLWADIEQFIVGPVFKKTVLQLRGKQDKKQNNEVEQLSFILADVAKSLIRENTSNFVECRECCLPYDLQCNNQLGHNCVTTTPEDAWACYFYHSLALLEPKCLAQAFVKECGELATSITAEFLNSIDAKQLFQTTKALF